MRALRMPVALPIVVPLIILRLGFLVFEEIGLILEEAIDNIDQWVLKQ